MRGNLLFVELEGPQPGLQFSAEVPLFFMAPPEDGLLY
jgi:hypothetical protein